MVVLQNDICSLKEESKVQVQTAYFSNIPHRSLEYITSSFPPTDDSLKYSVKKNSKGEYSFDQITSKVQAVIINNDQCLQKGDYLGANAEVSVFLDKTNCWSFEKGVGDIASIEISDKDNNIVGIIDVRKVINFGGYLLHSGTFQSSSETKVRFEGPSWKGTVTLDESHRFGLMRNTTASHILNFVLKKRFVASLESLLICNNYFCSTFHIFGQSVTDEDITFLENEVKNVIKRGIHLKHSVLSMGDINKARDIIVPAFINLNNNSSFSVIELNIDGKLVREVSVGPNLLSSADVEQFCLVDVQLKNRKRELCLTGITGGDVLTAIEMSNAFLSTFSEMSDEMPALEVVVSDIQLLLKQKMIPWSLKSEMLQKLEFLKSAIKRKNLDRHVQEMSQVLAKALEQKDRYIVHYAGEDCKLEKLTRLCSNLPVMLFAYNREGLTVRCCVPQDSAFTAEEWIRSLAAIFSGKGVALKGHDPATVFCMKPLKLNRNDLDKTKIELKETAKLIAEQLIERKGNLST